MSTKTDWWEVAFTIVCVVPAFLMVLYMAWRVIFG